MKNLMCLLFLLVFCLSINLKANSPIIIPNFPQCGQENIAVNSKISFHTNYEIDTSSLIHLSPIQNFYVNDTVFVEKKYAQIMLIRKEYYQNVPDSLHYIYATEGSITTNADNITINFNIHSLLDYETEYTLVVKDLFVIKPDTTQPSGYDTLAIDTTIVDFFKTTEVPIQLVSTSIDDREYQVLAGENLELLFSKKFLSSDLTNHNIATLAKVIDTVYVDSVNYYYVLDTVSTQRTLALDSTKIILNPDSLLELGKSYILSVDLKNVYGEYQPFFKEFWVKNYAKITLITRASYYDPDTNVVTDLFGSVYYEPDFDNAPLRDTVDNSFMGIVESQDVIYYPGTEFLARVPVTTPNDFYFVGFECPEDTTLNANYEDNTISVALTNTNLMDRTIIAKYNLAEDLQIELPFNVNIRGYDNIVCTKDSTIVYSFKNLPHREVTIFPQFTSGVPFLEWTSNDPVYNGSGEACISIPSSPKFDPGPFGNPWKRGFKVNWDDMHTPCMGSRYKVELFYKNTTECKGLNKAGSLNIPLPQEIYPNDIISSFEVINIDDDEDFEEVDIIKDGTAYYGVSDEYTAPNRLHKIIKFEINPLYKDKYEISYVKCTSNGIFEGSPNGQYYYDSELNGEAWEHEIENKNLEIHQFGVSTNCVETVTVHIRRKLHKLTIEREMTDGSHVPTNLITFQLRNSDDTAPVDFLEYKTPEKVTVDNEEGGKDITNFKTFYAIPSGVDIRIVPECKANSGYSLDEWNCDDDYTCTDVLPNYTKQEGNKLLSRELVLSTTMNQDKKVDMILEAGFRLDYVGYDRYYIDEDDILQKKTYFLKAGPERTSISPDQDLDFINNDFFNKSAFGLLYGNISEEYAPNEYHKRPCRIKLHFNKNVNLEGLEQGFYVEDDIDYSRNDGNEKQIYRLKFKDNDNQIYGVHYNAVLEDNDGNGNGKKIEFLLINVEDEKKWAPHMQHIKFHFDGNLVKSTEDEILGNAQEVNLVKRTTALPGIKIRTFVFYCGDDSECWLWPDIEAYVYCSVTLRNNGAMISNPPGMSKNEDGTYKFGTDCKKLPTNESYHSMRTDSRWACEDEEVFTTHQLNETNSIFLYFQMNDQGNYGLNFEKALKILAKVYKDIATGEKEDFWAKLGKVAVTVTSEIVDGDITKKNDRTIGYTGILLNMNNMTFQGEQHINEKGKYTKEYITKSIWGASKLYYEEDDIGSAYYDGTACRFALKFKVELGDFGN